jgi:hypothetical protein
MKAKTLDIKEIIETNLMLNLGDIIENHKDGYVLSDNEVKILGQYCAKVECHQCHFKKNYGKCPIAVKLSIGGFFIDKG